VEKTTFRLGGQEQLFEQQFGTKEVSEKAHQLQIV